MLAQKRRSIPMRVTPEFPRSGNAGNARFLNGQAFLGRPIPGGSALRSREFEKSLSFMVDMAVPGSLPVGFHLLVCILSSCV